jgi:hypothetical protein
MSQDEIEKIISSEVQDYIFAHKSDDEKKLLLQRSEILGLPASLIAQQIAIRRKAEDKLPLFYKTKGVLYPPSLQWEQCSSEAAAAFKADKIAVVGNSKIKIADLTGGFGIDSLFFSKRAELLDYVEPNTELLNIARHNHKLFGCENIHYHQGTADEFLNKCKTSYDLVYLDPSRRNVKSQKIFKLSDCQPTIKEILPGLFDVSEFVLVKTSPLLDIQQGLLELSSVAKIMVVSVNNECKELLFLMQKGFAGEPPIEAFNLDTLGNVKHFFVFTMNEEKRTDPEYSEPETYLYEPNASILKAGAFKTIAKRFDLRKLHNNTHLYTSARFKENFPGRIFEIHQPEFKWKDYKEKKANVITRNYPLKAEELKKKLKLTDGGEKYVIGFSSKKKKHVVLATRLA